MNDRRLSDDRIAAALRTHLPARAQPGLPNRVMDAIETTAQLRPLPSFLGALSDADPVGARRSLLVAAAVLLVLALASAAAAGAWQLLHRDTVLPPSGVSNGWIAYSTDGPSPGGTDITSGSDIYLVRGGGAPILIAGRDGGATRNACPSFSPDGTRLAYASSSGPAIVVRGVDTAGVTSESIRIAVPGGGWPICVRWSADSKRLAYLELGVVVRGLDGSTLARTAGDPGPGDLASPPDDLSWLSSPSGEWVASVRVDRDPCQLVVARPDGTDVHVIPLGYCPYAIAAWSPDSTTVLLMEDVSGMDFTMHEVAIDSGVQSVVVSTVRTNGARSWPGKGDVSWQPVLP